MSKNTRFPLVGLLLNQLRGAIREDPISDWLAIKNSNIQYFKK